MNSRKILKEALKGCDREEVAKYAGMTLGSLNNQIAGELPYLPKGKTQNMLDRVYNLIDITYETTGKALILEKLAEEFGFFLIKNPSIIADETPAVSKVTEIIREFGLVIDEFGRANEDLRIEKYEAEKIRDRWEMMKRITEEFLCACEAGVYDRKGENHV